jgi:hypothetical protein
MAATSEQLLSFIDSRSTIETKFNSDGEIAFQTEALLEGDSLATALRAVADLAAHEGGLAFANRQHADRGGAYAFGSPLQGPQAN